MAIKILEGPAKYTFVKSCPGCKAKLQAEADDLMSGRFGSFGDYEREVYFCCPVCTTRIVLKAGADIPSALYYRIPERDVPGPVFTGVPERGGPDDR